STVILYSDGIISMNGHEYIGTITSHRFVDRVIDYFINQVMQPFYTSISNIHGGPFPYSLYTFEDLYIIGRIIIVNFFAHILILQVTNLRILSDFLQFSPLYIG